MRINGCLSLVTQLGAEILNTLRQDIYLLHNELPLAMQALSGWEAGRPTAQAQQPLLQAMNPHSIIFLGRSSYFIVDDIVIITTSHCSHRFLSYCDVTGALSGTCTYAEPLYCQGKNMGQRGKGRLELKDVK